MSDLFISVTREDVQDSLDKYLDGCGLDLEDDEFDEVVDEVCLCMEERVEEAVREEVVNCYNELQRRKDR